MRKTAVFLFFLIFICGSAPDPDYISAIKTTLTGLSKMAPSQMRITSLPIVIVYNTK